ncbi:transglycosylase SLT domain-containing protein [Thermodesulfobacteriota bacterium]
MNKKILLLLISLLLFFQLLRADESEYSPQHPLDSHLTEIWTGDLPEMIERRYVRVLTTINQTNFFLDGLKPHGFEYSLLKEYENSLNRVKNRRKLRVTFEFIPVARDKLLENLITGYGDIAAAGLTVTPLRNKKVDFTEPYLSDISELLITHKDVKTIAEKNDMSGEEVFIRKSSSYYESITALNDLFEMKGESPIKIIEADENLETEDILEMVSSGAIKMTVCDSHIAEVWSKVLPDIKIQKDVVFRKRGKIAWAVRKDCPVLKEDLNRFIQRHKIGTLIGNIFFKRYYENMNWIKNPLQGKYAKKINKYKPIFEKYSDKYGFDWRLILSMAFQESGLNNDKKSARGAVGIMQIKQTTANDPKIGIKDVKSAENNIHAAVKYLDFIRNRYFSDESIRPRDRVRFALAAFNAGPVKIRKARNMARSMNLDPDRWFRNVELAVLRSVGQETVKYVSNINKYYVIYDKYLDVKKIRETIKEDK